MSLNSFFIYPLFCGRGQSSKRGFAKLHMCNTAKNAQAANNLINNTGMKVCPGPAKSDTLS